MRGKQKVTAYRWTRYHIPEAGRDAGHRLIPTRLRPLQVLPADPRFMVEQKTPGRPPGRVCLLYLGSYSHFRLGVCVLCRPCMSRSHVVWRKPRYMRTWVATCTPWPARRAWNNSRASYHRLLLGLRSRPRACSPLPRAPLCPAFWEPPALLAPYPPHSPPEQGLQRVARDQLPGTQDFKGQRHVHRGISGVLLPTDAHTWGGRWGVDRYSCEILNLFCKRSS